MDNRREKERLNEEKCILVDTKKLFEILEEYDAEADKAKYDGQGDYDSPFDKYGALK